MKRELQSPFSPNKGARKIIRTLSHCDVTAISHVAEECHMTEMTQWLATLATLAVRVIGPQEVYIGRCSSRRKYRLFLPKKRHYFSHKVGFDGENRDVFLACTVMNASPNNVSTSPMKSQLGR